MQTYDQIYTTNYPRWGGTTARNYTSPLLHTVTLTDLAPATTCAPALCMPVRHCIMFVHCRGARTLPLLLGMTLVRLPAGRAQGCLVALIGQPVWEAPAVKAPACSQALSRAGLGSQQRGRRHSIAMYEHAQTWHP